MKRLKKYLFCLLLAITLLSLTLSPALANTKYKRAIWVWKTEQILANKKAKGNFLEFIQDLPGTEAETGTIFLYTSFEDLKEKRTIGQLVRSIHENGYKVEALNGDPNWAKHHSTPLAYISNFINYQKSVSSEERFDGLQFDIEPHVLGIYGIEKKRKVIHEKYLELLEQVNFEFETNGLSSTLGIAVPVAFSEDYIRQLLKYVDYLAVMDYFDSSRTINHYAQKFIRTSASVNEQLSEGEKLKEVYIGIETQIPNDRWGVGASNTFYDEGYDKMEEILSEVIRTFNGYSSFGGIAIHDYNAYTLLNQEGKPLTDRRVYPVLPYIEAKKIENVTVDGTLSEWDMTSENKTVIHLGLDREDVVYGRRQWQGSEDYRALISTAWDNNYLYIGLSVTDDIILQQATGVDMLNGDHIEILIDYDLKGDEAIKVMNDDDFQLGVSPGNFEDVKASLAYWFPQYIQVNILEKIKYAAQKTAEGYDIEIAIPWSLSKGFQPQSGQKLRINIDPSDTDRNPNFQETLLSTSPHREHANPRTFRTLILR